MLIVSTLLTLTLSIWVAPASALSGPEVLANNERVMVVRDGDWVRHNFSQSLPDSSSVIVQGEHIVSRDGVSGCTYRGVETNSPGEIGVTEVKISREIAHNSHSCQMEFETAVLTVGQARALDIISEPVKMKTASAAAGKVQHSSQSDGTWLRSATTTGTYQKLYYEDPPQIDVTSVTARVRWTYTGTCTTWSRHSAAWGWYSPSGWSRTAHSWGHDRSCEYGATTSNSGTYRNGTFCASVDTWNRYNVNYVQGLSNGSIRYEWDHQKWGGCTILLSFHRVTGYWSG